MSKPLYLPAVTRFEELFSECEVWTSGERAPAHVFRQGREQMAVGCFLVISGRGNHDFPRQSFAVKPTPFLLDWIGAHVMFVGHDTLNFEMLVQADGNCLMIVCHGQIIGNYWLTANLRVESLPALVKRPAPAVEIVYTFPNGFAENAGALFTGLCHANLNPQIGNGPEGSIVLSLPVGEVSCLRRMQQADPARFGNPPEEVTT